MNLTDNSQVADELPGDRATSHTQNQNENKKPQSTFVLLIRAHAAASLAKTPSPPANAAAPSCTDSPHTQLPVLQTPHTRLAALPWARINVDYKIHQTVQFLPACAINLKMAPACPRCPPKFPFQATRISMHDIIIILEFRLPAGSGYSGILIY